MDVSPKQDSAAPWWARWLIWSLWWEIVVAIGAGVAFVVYALALERQFASEGIIQGADSFYAAQEVALPLWLLAALATPFVVYSKVRRQPSNSET